MLRPTMTKLLHWLTHGLHRPDGADDAAESFERVDSTALEAGAFRASGSMGLQQLAAAAPRWSPLSGPVAQLAARAHARIAPRAHRRSPGA